MAMLKDEVMIKGMRLRNRVALPPLTTNYASPEGMVTEGILEFYRKRARDVGLVIVEATAVRADGRLVPGSLGLWEDGQVAGIARLADSIKKQGAAAVVQINHAGARCVPCGGEMQGASPSGFAFRPDVEPFTMNPAQIEQMISDFGDAVGRQMIADPEAAGKLLAGKGDEIVPCEECMNCLATIGRGEPMSCKVNRGLAS